MVLHLFLLELIKSGGRQVFELHHKVKVSEDGEVYGLNNIFVMTPKRHINLHKEA